MELADRGLKLIQDKAKKLKIKGEISISPIKTKRFRITLEDGTNIDFGLWKPKIGTYFDLTIPNKDEILMNRKWVEERRKNWIARHSEIMTTNKDGKRVKAINYKYSPDYYSARLLW